MAFSGFFVKIGSGQNEFTLTGEKYIALGSYSAVPKVQDIDPYRDSDGVLHRNVIQHSPLVVKFKTLDYLDNTEMGELFNGIARNYINALERSVLVTAYVPEKDEYMTQKMYLAEPQPSIDKVEHGKVIYNALDVELIGY